MTNRDLLKILKETGFPVRYGFFKTKTSPPYLVFNQVATMHRYADNCEQARVKRWQVDLITSGKKSEQEEQLEAVLTENRLHWSSFSAGQDGEEGYLRFIYEFETVEGIHGED